MSKGDATRERMVESATHLFMAQGYAATGLKQILEEGDAPRGSLYFHFPGGKEELAAAVVERHAELFATQLEAALEGAGDVVSAVGLVLAHLAQLVESGEGVGCPVSVVALEMAERSATLQKATQGAFSRWAAVLWEALVEDGMPEEEARRRARALLCAVEGALVLARPAGDAGPLRDVASIVPALLGR
ncbi:MAG: TetR/AcrR family transcriptional regulator [Sandaracinaceae bacterium]|nr:TetR/AcrR family transcriptional regulator [Sandaracinaceae bacterium]